MIFFTITYKFKLSYRYKLVITIFKNVSKSSIDSIESIEEDIEELGEIKVDPNSVKRSFNFSD